MGSGSSKEKKKKTKVVECVTVGDDVGDLDIQHSHKQQHEIKEERTLSSKMGERRDADDDEEEETTARISNGENDGVVNASDPEDGLDPLGDIINTTAPVSVNERPSVDSLDADNLLMRIEQKVEKKTEAEKQMKSTIAQPEHRKKTSFSTKVFNDALDEIDTLMEQQHKSDEKLESKAHKPKFEFDAAKFKQANPHGDGDFYGEEGQHDNAIELESGGEKGDRDSLDFRLDDLDESLMKDIETNH
eukprot:m.9338 g.9338  ORF g.9338 m.9338 type:complete len:246 (-) comp6325_c0_seq1:88-825(-)